MQIVQRKRMEAVIGILKVPKIVATSLRMRNLP